MKRIALLDAWRSLCVVIMVVYHGLYDLMLFGAFPARFFELGCVVAVRYFALCGFILISGIAARWSQNCVRRGFFLLCIGLGVTAATTLAGMQVAFGILHFFGVAMLLYGAAKVRIDGWSGPALPLLCLASFAFTFYISQTVRVEAAWLYPLGLRSETFFSADYYPVFPWLFVFLLGTWLGGLREKYAQSRLLGLHVPGILTFPGRHSLVIYLVHQPVMYGLCCLLFSGK